MNDLATQREHDSGHHPVLWLAAGILGARERFLALLERHAPRHQSRPVEIDSACLALLGAIAFLERTKEHLESHAPRLAAPAPSERAMSTRVFPADLLR